MNSRGRMNWRKERNFDRRMNKFEKSFRNEGRGSSNNHPYDPNSRGHYFNANNYRDDYGRQDEYQHQESSSSYMAPSHYNNPGRCNDYSYEEGTSTQNYNPNVPDYHDDYDYNQQGDEDFDYGQSSGPRQGRERPPSHLRGREIEPSKDCFTRRERNNLEADRRDSGNSSFKFDKGSWNQELTPSNPYQRPEQKSYVDNVMKDSGPNYVEYSKETRSRTEFEFQNESSFPRGGNDKGYNYRSEGMRHQSQGEKKGEFDFSPRTSNYHSQDDYKRNRPTPEQFTGEERGGFRNTNKLLDYEESKYDRFKSLDNYSLVESKSTTISKFPHSSSRTEYNENTDNVGYHQQKGMKRNYDSLSDDNMCNNQEQDGYYQSKNITPPDNEMKGNFVTESNKDSSQYDSRDMHWQEGEMDNSSVINDFTPDSDLDDCVEDIIEENSEPSETYNKKKGRKNRSRKPSRFFKASIKGLPLNIPVQEVKNEFHSLGFELNNIVINKKIESYQIRLNALAGVDKIFDINKLFEYDIKITGHPDNPDITDSETLEFITKDINRRDKYKESRRALSKPFKVILTGVPRTTNVKDIKQALIQLGFDVRNVYLMRRTRTQYKKGMSPFQAFFIQLEMKPDNERIYQITELLDFKIKFHRYGEFNPWFIN